MAPAAKPRAMLLLVVLAYFVAVAMAGDPSDQAAIDHWEKAMKANPQSVEPILELAEQLRRVGQRASPPERGNAHIERAIQLSERAFAMEPENGLCHIGLSLALKGGAIHLRQSSQQKAQVLWSKLSDLVRDGIKLSAKKRIHDPLVISARKWKDFADKLRTARRDEETADFRCLGCAKEWSLHAWKNQQVAKRIDAFDDTQAAAVQKALTTGSVEPLILSGGKPNLRLDGAFTNSSEQLVEISVTHDKGLALKIENILPWKRNSHVEREFTEQNLMNSDIKAEAAAQGGVSQKVVVRGAFTHMLLGDFIELAAQPAYKQGEHKPSRPNLYMIAGNLQVFMPKLGAQLLSGELSEPAGKQPTVLDHLLQRFNSMQDKTRGRHELNLWMG